MGLYINGICMRIIAAKIASPVNRKRKENKFSREEEKRVQKWGDPLMY